MNALCLHTVRVLLRACGCVCGTSKSVNQRNGIINKNTISYKSSDVSIKHKQHDTIRWKKSERDIYNAIERDSRRQQVNDTQFHFI